MSQPTASYESADNHNRAEVQYRKPTPGQKRAVRQCYVRGEGSLAVCAAKFGVREATAYWWSDEEEWGDLRRDFDARETERLIASTKPGAATEGSQGEPQREPKPSRSVPGKLERLEEQLEAIDKAIDEAEPEALLSLWRAKGQALEAWALLTGFPKPGTRKVPRSRAAQPGDVGPSGVANPLPSEPQALD